MPAKLPHPVPYQGSKRMLAPRIGAHVPRDVEVWFDDALGA
jgi:site-specific DNA-adenine methylase